MDILEMDILGSGALNLDLVYEVSDLDLLRSLDISIEPGSELAIDHELARKIISVLERYSKKLASCGGGSAANTITILASMGLRAGFVGTVGEDKEADQVLSSMKGVDIGLVRKRGRTAICIVLLERGSRDRALLVAPNKELDTRIDEPLKEALSNTRVLHLSSLVQDEGLFFHSELKGRLDSSQIFSLDPGELYARRGLKGLSELIERADLLFVTEKEAYMLAGSDLSLSEALEYLLSAMHKGANQTLPFGQTGGPVILCKQGSEGAVLYSHYLKRRIFARRVEDVVDNTGAGDAFAAGFLYGMLTGKELSGCLELATEMAANSLRDYGRNWLR